MEDSLEIKTIAVLTSGGDSPGMNVAIRAVCKAAFAFGMSVYGVRRGYQGLINNDIFRLTSKEVGGIIDRGGTFLLSARCEDFRNVEGRAKAAENLKAHGIQGLIVIGGDGSYRGADMLYKEHGIKVIGLPGTIDNDISGTDFTIGFDTALNTILDAVSKIRDTATSHERTYIIEVMGRDAGYLALYACMAGGGDGLLIPERGYNIEEMGAHIAQRFENGKLHDIVICAEGVAPAEKVAEELKPYLTKKEQNEMRVTILGHVQRGGAPTAMDRILASKLGYYAVEMLAENQGGIMVGVESNKLVTYPISHAWKYKKHISEKDFEITMALAK
ncbi:MAG: 6-phosphofructokinase [Fusobacteria bacterium]|nr:6-phosphofructokinase [Fusobacteriota bacterium]